ncbi:alanyl-tRNA synthetase [Flexibacter flexilis DSM 6793]|uniref:Alanine--tRNA ligase n=1 Tax=Flexibacter flexilis DSM 6793 TaxID=927664 RepID=A0A1I1F9N9_9BACT|nr:alanine--tRNA ligase [Flexibacter flexilis]SFB96209.1 alanyl-tRNA synthetase [Flexibacter flexilis DSM 6793]
MLDSKTIRQQFLDFFQEKGHQIVPSAPLVLKNDPTLMFTNSGMAQFKDYFLGNKVAPFKRVADTQKCLRVSGKHNDLEEVGHDTYHHTMFEMLGNWSFGDYFKKEAIEWSWELLTEVYKLPKDRLYATVFEGDAKDNMPQDSEALALWKQYLPDDHILFGNKKDNFWEMGETGPCGPCSEIHIDLRDASEIAKMPGRDLVNNDHPQVVEIWNNVFMQFQRMADGSLQPLPDRHVDTGMGFERLCMAIQGKQSNYDTDVFQPTIQFIAAKSGKKYGENRQTDVAMRVLADHIRAIAFTVADGQLPSNNKAGYVIRRILRRAVRYGYTFLGFKEPFLHTLVPLLADQFSGVFPELKAQQDFVAKVIQEEEAAFLRTLEVGLRKLDEIVKSGVQTIEGKVVFELYDTFGFPLDLTALIARENGLVIDEVGFQAEMAAQKARSRNAATTEAGDWVILLEDEESEFVGYDYMQTNARVIKYRAVTTKNKKQFQIVLDRTPFYGESGGQVGDSGTLAVVLADGSVKNIRISDTKKENDLIVHLSEDAAVESVFSADYQSITATINQAARLQTACNHSATHLLHAAMKEVLGSHVNQKGSLVNPEVLRFDFSHFAKVTDEELAKIEAIVNTRIRENIALNERRNVPIEEAKNMGAMALFGEKYGDFVRVITFNPAFSVELCGGTHVAATGQIGLCKITAESSVAAGVRRIEAVTGVAAEALVSAQFNLLQELKDTLKATDLRKSVSDLLEEKTKLTKQLEALQNEKTQQIKQEILAKIENKNGVNFAAEKVALPTADAMRQLAFEVRQKVENLFLVLAAEVDGKPQIAVILSDNLVADKGLDASKIVRELAKNIQGGGGGQAFFATAGGKNTAGLAAVVTQAATLV